MIEHVRLIDDGLGYASRRNKDGELENEKLFNYLVDRNFEFFPDRVNVLFGPNQCGKTTLIRSIASSLGIVDGWPKKFKYIPKEKSYLEYRETSLDFSSLDSNSCILDWDGAPVYYENFRDTMTNRNYGSFGDLAGSILDDITEVGFIMNKRRFSEGQLSLFVLNQLVKLFLDKDQKESKRPSWSEVLSGADKKQIEYFESLPGSKTGICTVLLDESDKSFDIDLQWKYLSGILPGIQKKLGIQLIVASHNPFLLSDKIFLNPTYNIISIDPKYTEKIRNQIKNIYGTTEKTEESYTEKEER